MTGRQGLVLVIDDDRAVRDSLKFALEIEGLLVHVFASGAELLAYPELRLAGCLVLDEKMPVMDGFAVLAHLATRKLRLPVILITTHATGRVRRYAAVAGVRHILEKPLLDGALLDSVREILGPKVPT